MAYNSRAIADIYLKNKENGGWRRDFTLNN